MSTTTTETEQGLETHSLATLREETDAHEHDAAERTEEETQLDPARSKWLVIAAATAVTFVGVGYTNAFGVFQEHYESTLFPHIPPSEIILIGSVASSLYMILGAFAGRFADSFGYQISLGLGSSLMIGGLFAASVSTKFYQLFLSQGLTFGLGISFAYLPAVSISRQYFGDLHHGLANGIVLSGGALGGCVLPYAVRVLLGQRGLPQTFRILAYLAAGILIPCTILLKPLVKPRPGRKNLLAFSLLRNRRFIVLMVASTIAMTGFLPRYFLITPSAIERGVSGSYAAWLLGIMNGLSILGRVGVGWFADRYGKVTALVCSFVLCGLGHVIFWLPSVLSSDTTVAQALFTLFVVFVGLFGSGFVSVQPVVVAHLFGANDLASKFGLLNSVIGLGVLAGPSAVYAIVSDGEKWYVGVLTAGLLMVVGGMFLAGAMKQIDRSERRGAQQRSE